MSDSNCKSVVYLFDIFAKIFTGNYTSRREIMKSFLMLVIFWTSVLVKGDYYIDYFVKWLMREKMVCVFEEFDVSEDVLSHVPENMLQVQIGDTKATPGDKFSPTSLFSPPAVIWDCEDFHVKSGAEIAIVMVGADPGNQTLVWLVNNITGCDVTTGQEVCKYQPPSPSDGRPHLYIICQFMRQPSYDIELLKLYNSRGEINVNPQNFSMTNFAKGGRYGDPYACNFIVLQNDASQDGTAYAKDRPDCDVYGEYIIFN